MILVTGSAGFIGSCLVNELVKNYKVVGIDDLSSGSKKIFFLIDLMISNESPPGRSVLPIEPENKVSPEKSRGGSK